MKTKVKLIFLPLIAVTLGVCVWKACDDMSVVEIKNEFREHKSRFEEVVSMAKTDRALSRVSKWRSESPERLGGIGADRVAEYRRHLAAIDCPAIAVFRDPLEIFFRLDSRGLSVSGRQSGVAYVESQTIRGILSTNLQTEMDRPTETNFQFEQIEGNWYVYFLYED